MKPSTSISVPSLTLLVSAFFVAACNIPFWTAFSNAVGGLSLATAGLYFSTILVLVLFFNAFLSLASFRPILKPLLTVLFIGTAAAVHFMSQYGVALDSGMIQNSLETDVREAAELVNMRLLVTIALLGVVPSVLLWRTKVRYPSIVRGVLVKIGMFGASLGLAALILFIFFQSIAPVAREHRHLRYLITPANYIHALQKTLRPKMAPVVVAPLGTDASKGPLWENQQRRTVTVIVVGETARAQNFSLNGYARDTNPQLRQQADLVNFGNVYSCGTATAVSVPCVFSAFGRTEYTDAKAKSQEGLLDVLRHAGFDLLWRSNNSGCKGVCDRIGFEDLSRPTPDEPLCNKEECFDERLLHKLPELIRASSKDMVIVLHQKGSHGPAYWKRYPEAFKRFGPVCETTTLNQCTQEALVAAYDNTILYTDHFLSKTIDMLRESAERDGIDTAFMYFSDHGESLGEKNMYLHGAPYMLAPVEQRHVPFMVWLSDGFRSRFQIDQQCLKARAGEEYSHDNVFHSVLGMLNVRTDVYNPSLNIFQACTNGK